MCVNNGGGWILAWCGGTIFLETRTTFIWDQKEKDDQKKPSKEVLVKIGAKSRIFIKRAYLLLFLGLLGNFS